MVPIVGLAIDIAIWGILGAIGYSKAKDLVSGCSSSSSGSSSSSSTTTYTKSIMEENIIDDISTNVSGTTRWCEGSTVKSFTSLRKLEYSIPYANEEPDDKYIEDNMSKDILIAIARAAKISVDRSVAFSDILIMFTDKDKKIIMFLIKKHKQYNDIVNKK